MSIRRLLTQPLRVQHNETALDEYGNTIPSGTTTTDVSGYLEQRQSKETLLNRDTTVTTWIAYLPAGTPVTSLDRVLFAEQVFQVTGEPWLVFNPRTRAVDHIECELTVMT